MDASLDGVWAKVARAAEHLNVLDEYIAATLAPGTNQPVVSVRFDAETRECIVYVSEMGDFSEIPVRCALIVGDVVHNLRAALDHLALQLAITSTKGNVKRPDRTAFPICDSRRHFLADARRYLREVRGFRTRIEKLQPYPRRQRNLGLIFLRELDNRDKHRLLIPAIVAPEEIRVALRAGAIASGEAEMGVDAWGRLLFEKPWNGTHRVELGAVLHRFTPDADLSGAAAQVLGRLTAQIEICGLPVMVVLHGIFGRVGQTIGAFEDVFE